MSKRILEQTECPRADCGSSDAFTIYLNEDGTTTGYCFSCNRPSPVPASHQQDGSSEEPNVLTSTNSRTETAKSSGTTSGTNTSLDDECKDVLSSDLQEALSHPIRSLTDRRLSYDTCKKYGVRVGVSTQDGSTPIYHLYPRHINGELADFKVRYLSKKSFKMLKGTSSSQVDLFGQHLCREGGKKLFITEGELDALALYQTLKEHSSIPGWEPSVVSLPDGSASAAKAISANLDFINTYEQVILVFDNDDAGKKARDEVCKILAGKVYTVTLPRKDPCDMLMHNQAIDLKWAALTHAKKYHPDGILNAADCWERYKEAKDTPRYPYPTTMPGLQQHLQGAGDGSIVLITSGTGCGKTAFTRELEYHFWKTTDEKIASIKLEEDVGDTVAGLMSLHMNKRITLPDVEVDPNEERKCFEELFSDGRFSVYDFFGGMDDESLFSKLRFYAATGHKFIFLDHLSIIVSEYAAAGGERERIDTIMTKLARFVKETGCILFLVVHLRKTDGGTPFEQGAAPTLDALRGSGSLKQLAWDVIGLSRNQQHEDKFCANTTEVISLKCRFTGRTGVTDYLHFDQNSGRMINVEKPLNYRPTRKSKFGNDDRF